MKKQNGAMMHIMMKTATRSDLKNVTHSCLKTATSSDTKTATRYCLKTIQQF